MKTSRREFIKKSTLFGSVSLTGTYPLMHKDNHLQADEMSGEFISLDLPKNKKYFKPLERLDLVISTVEKGFIKVYDGRGNQYHADEIRGRLNFKAGGNLGYHQIHLIDNKEKLVDLVFFPVNGETEIEDKKGEFHQLLESIKYPLYNSSSGLSHYVRLNKKNYRINSGVLNKDINCRSLGTKYFIDLPKDAIDLFSEGQRADGLIYDSYQLTEDDLKKFNLYESLDFIYQPEDPHSSFLFIKFPFGNITQYSFIAGIYNEWKESGDDLWMKNHLESAIKAIEFIPGSEYFWSAKYQLIRRQFSTDMWEIQEAPGNMMAEGNATNANSDKVIFGIHFYDNILFAEGCELLAEMLEYVKNNSKSGSIRKLGDDVKTKINKLAWNGSFYRHFIPEDETVKHDLGVDPNKQISMSNAFSLNHNIGQEKCISILQSYQRILNQLPDGSPGEWYTIIPPFAKDVFGINEWQFLNGGVSPIVSGELAKGAFANGFESYGVDILRRTAKSFNMLENPMKGIYNGSNIENSAESNLAVNESIIPTERAASNLVNALIGGLVGIEKIGAGFNNSSLSPKWTAAEIESATAMILLEGSGEYLSYRYKMIPDENKLIIEFTGSSQLTQVKILVPKNKQLKGIYCDREMCGYEFSEIHDSGYANLEVNGIGVHIVEARFA